MPEYRFDFSKNFTISDYAAYMRWKDNQGDVELYMQFYETVDKFFIGDLFALDMKEVTQVIMQFSVKLVEHLERK